MTTCTEYRECREQRRSPSSGPSAVALLVTILLFIAQMIAPSRGAIAQEPDAGSVYRIGKGDVLQLSVWQQPDLDRELRVRDDGTIVAPLVGELDAAGLSVPELEDQLTRRLRAFNRDITEVAVSVLAYNSLEIYVMGAVLKPGAYTFTQPPNAWDALRRAGGPTESANLSRVRVINEVAGRSVTSFVDLSDVIAGRVPDAPLAALRGGATIMVADLTSSVGTTVEHGVSVMGAVEVPRLYSLDEPTPLLAVILRAGGFADGAKLDSVRIVRAGASGTDQAQQVDVRKYIDEGRPSGNPMVHPGDTVYVDASGSTWNVVGIVTAATGVAAILTSLFRN